MQNLTPTTKGEVAIYQPDNSVHLEVLTDQETVWLNWQQLSVLFDRDIKTIELLIKSKKMCIFARH